jgi:hypothetical protein
LEPACGNGNFLVEIVRQRLERIKKNPNYRPAAKREFAIIKTLSTIYGVDVAPDNVEECKKRILDIIFDKKTKYAPAKSDKTFLLAIQKILDTNIILGDMLNGKDKIFFVEYSTLGAEYLNKCKIQRKVFALTDMEDGKDEPLKTYDIVQISSLTDIDLSEFAKEVSKQPKQTDIFAGGAVYA